MERDGKGADRQRGQQSSGGGLAGGAADQRGTGKEGPSGQCRHGGYQAGDDDAAALPVGSIMEIVTMEQPAGNTGEGGGRDGDDEKDGQGHGLSPVLGGSVIR